MPPILFAQETNSATDGAENLWSTIVSFITKQGMDLAINIVAALAILIFGRWIAKLVTRILRRVLKKSNVDETLRIFLGNILYGLLLMVVILAALSRLGVNTTSFAAVMAAAGLAVGLALKDSLSNFASGVMLILFKPFNVGDSIDAGGSKGVVEEIHLFNTIMRTGDNIQIIVPNGQITSGTITNFSAKDTRRIELIVSCGYDDDLKAVKAFLLDLLVSDERILKDPQPVVAVSELGDSSVNLVVRPWVNRGDYSAVRWDLNEKIKTGFDERGFNIPYPTQDIHVHGATG